MMFALGKLFNFIFNPVFLGLLFLLGVMIGTSLRRQWRVTLGVGVAFVWFWLWSTPWLYSRLGGGLESPYPPRPVEQYPKGDFIVLLGGGVSRHPVSPYPELFSASDRVFQAARLYRAGKAKKIIVTGAQEKETSFVLLQELGVPADGIIVENSARNTDENALRVRELATKEKKDVTILLVTSAWHMRRAEHLFRKAGFSVTPVATDYEGLYFKAFSERTLTSGLMPTPEMLGRNSLMLKEYLGYWVYRWRGGGDK